MGVSKIEHFLKNFPITIPGARKVGKYGISNAKHCLVHILQEHKDDEFVRGQLISKVLKDRGYDEKSDRAFIKKVKNMLKNELILMDKGVEKVQRDIYSILSYLIDRYNIKDIYIEGLDSMRADLFNRLSDLLTLEKTLIKDIGKNSKPLAELRKFLAELRKSKVYSLVSSLEEEGGAAVLWKEGKIRVKATEKFGLNEYPDLVANYLREPVSMSEEREDYVLMSVANNGDSIALVVYGGDHIFGGKKTCGKNYNLEERMFLRDNIYEWNKRNPDRKFSLIEVVPKSYSFK